MVTESQIISLLYTNPRFVEAAIVILHNRTPADEEARLLAHHSNKRGLGYDARRGSYYARLVEHGYPLTGKDLKRARDIAICYADQLVDVFNECLSHCHQQ